MTYMRDKFDFDIGYLVKSPCKGCPDREQFPGCLRTCPTLDKVQTLLARGISSSRDGGNTDFQAFGTRIWDPS